MYKLRAKIPAESPVPRNAELLLTEKVHGRIYAKNNGEKRIEREEPRAIKNAGARDMMRVHVRVRIRCSEWFGHFSE
jgi:hypothetical protein